MMSMRCRKARRNILAALDGELGTAERESLNAHLSDCEACRAAADETTRLHRALAGMPQATDLPVGLETATLRRVRGVLAMEGSGRAGFETGLWWWLAAPLAATLAGVLVWRSLPGDGPPASEFVTAEQASRERLATGGAPDRAAEQVASRAAEGGHASEAAAPPPRVAETLDLFLEMPILENMEKLQNFDAIRTVDLGEGAGTEGGRG